MKREDYYSDAYTHYFDSSKRVLEQRERKAIDLLIDLSPINSGRFLDIGCGDGFFLQQVSNVLGNQFEYHGGEYSDHQRLKAIQRTGYTIVPIDLEDRLEFDDNSFDVIYSGEVIEHLYNPDNMVRELARILKQSGYCLITTPNLNSWISRILFPFGMQPINYECSTVSSLYGYRWFKSIKKQEWPVGHVRLFNIYSLRDMLEANGLSVVQIQGAIFEFAPPKIRWLDLIFSKFPSLSSGLVVLAKKN